MSLLDPWTGSQTGVNLVNNANQQQQTPAPQPGGGQPSQQQAPPPAGAQGYDPLGRPYFGPGITGTFKKYYWQLMGSPTSGLGLDNWNAIVDDFKKAETQRGQEWKDTNKDILKRSAAGLFGADVGKLEEEDTSALEAVNEKLKQREKELADQYKLETGVNFVKSAQGAYLSQDELYQNLSREQLSLMGTNAQKATSFDVNGQNVSLAAPLVRATTVGLTALMDLLQEPAIKSKQVLGALEEVRDSTEGIIATRNDLADTFLNMIPAVSMFNTAKFIFSPKSAKEKGEIIKTGYDTGRIFYTSLFDEAVEQDFKARAAEGQDPQLLAMELANPWAEMAGELILDPLNVVGYISKAFKVAQVSDDISDTVKVVSGLADNADFMNAVTDMSKVGTAADAVRASDKAVNAVVDYVHGKNGIKNVIVPEQKYASTALNSAGNQLKATRNMGNTFTWIVSSVKKAGGGFDQVDDAIAALLKISSPNPEEVREAFSALTHMPSPMTYFNQSSLQTSVMLRNMLEGADGALDVQKLISKVQGVDNWTAYVNKLKSVTDDAVNMQYPSVSELKKAADDAKQAIAIGNPVPKKTAKFAEQYASLVKNHPGVTHFAEIDRVLSKYVKDPANRILGTFYFSLNPAFAAKNWISGVGTTLFDDLSGSTWFRDGKYMSDKFIDGELANWHGAGNLPPAISDYKPLSSAMNAPKVLFGKLSDKIEMNFSKRIYYKHFRDTMDKAIQPGRALPSIEEFAKAGFTDGQVNRFTSLVRSNYGNVQEAAKAFTQEYASGGPDVWRMVDTLIQPKAYQGLVENGMMDEIMQFAKRDDVGPQEIEDFIDGLIREQKTRAASVVDDPVGMSRDNSFTRERADLFAGSQAYTDEKVEKYLDQLFERSTQTRDAYIKALQEIRDKTGDPELSKFLDSLMLREPDDIIRKKVAGINKNTRAILEQARTGRKNLSDLWNKLGTGTEFTGNTYKDFATAAWNWTLQDKIPTTWNSHFSAVFTESEKYATRGGTGVTELLKQAQDMNKEAQQWRTFAYREMQATDTIQASDKIKKQAAALREANAAGKSSSLVSEDYDQISKYLTEVSDGMTQKAKEFAKAQRAARETGEVVKVQYEKLSEVVSSLPNGSEAVDLATIENRAKQFGFDVPDELRNFIEESGGSVTKREALEFSARLELGILPNVDEAVEATQKIPENVQKEFDIEQKYRDEVRELKNKIKNTSYEDQLSQKLQSKLEFAEKKAKGQGMVVSDLLKKNNITRDQIKGDLNAAKKVAEQKIPPPYLKGSTVTPARASAETAAGAIDALNQLKRGMLDNYGIKAFEEVNANLDLSKITKTATDRVAEARLIAQKTGEHWRDFALFPYGETTHLDHALTYIYPYSFWYSRNYASWAQRLVTDPQIIAGYAKFKDTMAQEHKDAPEWWKQNVTLPEFMWGLNNGNPMYVNLEATLWPLYGLTGTDFNDPKKRLDWFTSTIDDMGKFGPSLWAPINLAIAAGLNNKGEQDAASRWAGRVVPQTATLKAIMAQMGATPIELDPAVQMFSGKGLGDTQALDPYERNRVGRALAQMVTDKLISEEQAIEVARTQEGDIWNQAVMNATQQRAPGQIASFFLGVGFKARSQSDMEIDQFYAEYFKLQEMNNNGYISKEDYKDGFNELREKYPFMDTVLLSRRAGEDRESAYAYNIISRIPPGMTSEIYDIIGIDPETAEKFWESGGSFEGWNEQEKQRFMTAMIDAGTMLAIPSNASRKEWTAAKKSHADMQEQIRKDYGETIYDQIDSYFNMDDAEKREYLDAFPEVEMAMQAEREIIINSPILSTYYGGLDTTYRYYSNKMYETLEKEFGDDISEKVDYYYWLKDGGDTKGANAYYKQEGLKAYFGRKSELEDELNRNVAESASNIKDGPGLLVYNEPQNPTQEAIQEFVTGPSQDSQIAQSVWGELSEYDQRLIQAYYDGEDLPYSVEKRLDYLGDDYGLSDQDILRILGTEIIQ